MRCQQFFANTLLTLYGAYSGILTYFTCFLFDINYHPLSETFFPTDEKLAKNVKKTSHHIKKSANSPRHPSRGAGKPLSLPVESTCFARGNKLIPSAKQVVFPPETSCFRPPACREPERAKTRAWRGWGERRENLARNTCHVPVFIVYSRKQY